MRTFFRIILTPFFLVSRLLLGSLAFFATISSAVIGLGISLVIGLALVEFLIGYWQNGIALLILSVLISPIGLPALANFLINRLDHAFSFLEGKMI